MATNSVDPLAVGRVIGDVIDRFEPTIDMSINYGTKKINNGCDIKPSMAADPPTVNIAGKTSDLYTLVMTDPDAPSPSDPKMREWLHWLVVNMPGSTDPSQGEVVVPYMGPQPPVGIHRYVFVLFQQATRLRDFSPPAKRAHFNTRSFAMDHSLGLPVAAVFFNSHKEPNNNRRR
ncbi:hypothetical protein LUZ63_014805 [Rhynchospora breviuscula]|uniref:Uncharacterized protein n=1 Tax=Rhynchospora breviuscula TaxID=2022672 RepID=A0A9Q0CBG2_9POAL|nr:hypothetical protein LUZ63_014805 [Rhynchospora breviuscula]